MSLRREDVDAIVFWTRHARPIFDLLPRLDAAGYRYYFQYTVTGYGTPLEPHAPPLKRAVATFRALAERLPPGAVVWRYDPIVVGPAMPAEEHVRRFRHIASALAGATRRVVVSFMDPYRKTRRRVGRLLTWGEDLIPEPAAWPGRHALLADLAAVAGEHGLEIQACAEEEDYASLGVGRTKCVDGELLTALFGGEWSAQKDPGQRPACRCAPSRDIGMPDTCTFGCAYCYATRSEVTAARRHGEHDPAATSLWEKPRE